MPSRVAEPLFGLIVLLAWPWLGLGDSARAGFVLRQRASSPELANPSAEFALIVTLDGEEAGASGAPSGGTGGEDGSGDEGSPWSASLPRQLLLSWPGVQTGPGAGGTSPSRPASGPGGSGLVGILAPNAPPPGAEGPNLLFLGDERFKPPPFASRLFRPPR
jgi:hypothetical protein